MRWERTGGTRMVNWFVLVLKDMDPLSSSRLKLALKMNKMLLWHSEGFTLREIALSLPAWLMSPRLEGDPDANMLKWVAFMHKGEQRLCGAIQLMSPSCYTHEHKEAIKRDCSVWKLNFQSTRVGTPWIRDSCCLQRGKLYISGLCLYIRLCDLLKAKGTKFAYCS